MDKNAIKKYAVWARTELIERVRQRALKYEVAADADINADSASGKVLTDIEKTQRQAAIARMREKGYEYVIEEVAYTWFNRFAALRYMEVNNYLPTRVRVFTDESGTFKPQILTEAIHLNLDGLDMEKVYALKEAENNDELYKYLLLTQCNALSSVLPQMFKPVDDRCKEEKNDYTLLLFPDNQLREGSVIEQMVSLIPEDNWLDAVQIIGWLYQYYNSEPKDKVFADLKKNIKITKENIPAATQLFTPDWIVRYMVENSLGRLWLEGHPQNSDTLLPTEEEQVAYIAGNRNSDDSKWHYYLKETQQEPEVEEQLAEIRKEYVALKPEDILCIDPCMGSGHILAYLFDTLMKIYAAYGYSTRESVQSIIEHNLYGLDIDDRAAQLAYFEVMMTAAKYDNRFLKRSDVPQPHVYAIQESNHIQYEKEFGNFLLTEEHRETLRYLLDVFQDAKEYGSILQVEKRDYIGFLEAWKLCAEATFENIMMIGWYMQANERVQALARQAVVLSQNYDVVVTNPPYMGGSGMNAKLSEFVKENFSDSKSDLFAVSIEKCMQMAKKNGFQAMITQHAWMSLASYEKLRTKLYLNSIVNMLHLGAKAFEEVSGEMVQTVSFVLQKRFVKNRKSTFCRLVDSTTPADKEQLYLSSRNRYLARQDTFNRIPGAPVTAYVAGDTLSLIYENGKTISSIGDVKIGMGTGNNDLFLRLWWEVNDSKIDYSITDVSQLAATKKKYFPYSKGGERKRWYGNHEYVVWYDEDGRKEMSQTSGHRENGGYEFYFHKGMTWSYSTMAAFCARIMPTGFVFDVNGSSLFLPEEYYEFVLAFLQSCVGRFIIESTKSAFSIQAGTIRNLPIIGSSTPALVELNESCINLSRIDWDSFETSWDFQQHPLIRWSKCLWDGTSTAATMHHYYGNLPEVSCPLELCFLLWQGECNEHFHQLKVNEEELNRIFIEIYDLQDELTPEVEDKDVTIRKADLQRDIKSFISYAVGCILGRYSLDIEGLVYAGGNYDEVYLKQTTTFGDPIPKENQKYRFVQKDGKQAAMSFVPDEDNIIPICDDEYFEDDITGLFVKFVEAVYGKEALDANLKFIADVLGGKGTPKEVIRNYFLNDFFNDHCKIYQKRPIYWLFDSGKKNGFKALVYMHRYQPDTIARMRTDYVHEQQSRYRTAIADLESRLVEASTAERVRLNKQLTKLRDQSEEIRKYEEKIHHLADQYIAIDLDDGVKVNYAKFQDVLAKIK